MLEPSILPGLTFGVDLVSPAEEKVLIAAIEQMELPRVRVRGLLQNRRTASFGLRYDFYSESLKSTEPLPLFLLALRERAARPAGMTPEMLEHTVVTKYNPGAGIMWHCDRPAFDQVIGISLGAPTILRFRRPSATGFDTAALPLPPRSIYCMTGEVRDLWQHKIPKMAKTRWSVTFRSLRPDARPIFPDEH